jgi:hypothetical protein
MSMLSYATWRITSQLYGLHMTGAATSFKDPSVLCLDVNELIIMVRMLKIEKMLLY